mmetsp:Transcript_60098/g.104858  ORF Transcript_60098/g.104858 Transcript_60098/m.104858 type:complete len:514 (+) Transcript_60098:72-1613(+)
MAELLDCPVCLEPFSDPQMLPSCGHTFCRGCIRGLQSRRCPTCRAAFIPAQVRPNFALRLVLQDLGLSSTAPPGELGCDEAATGKAGSCTSPDAADSGRIVRESSGDASGAAVHSDGLVDRLSELGVPWGLARLIREEDAQIALRLFLLDNSGSTSAADGHVLVGDPGQQQVMTCCSRWEEISNMALQQAGWNAHVGTPCEFMLLNPPSKRTPGAFRSGIDFLRVDAALGDVEGQQDRLHHMLKSTLPRGPTPLSTRLEEIYRRVEAELSDLVRTGQLVVLVIATDGLPTTEYSGVSSQADRQRLVRILRKLLGDLPLHVVVRLATDDEEVVDFYNRIDEELELPLEVIDDIESEAHEVMKQGNCWLTYCPLIHALREGGTFVKLFDLLDERQLTPTESLLLARLLLQDEYEVLPQEPEDFCMYVKDHVPNMELVYDPILKRMAPIINARVLRRAVLPLRIFACCRRRRKRLPPVLNLAKSGTRAGVPRRGYDVLSEPKPGKSSIVGKRMSNV